MKKEVLVCIGLVAVMLLGGQALAFYYKTASLPEPRQMYGTAVLGDYLYVIGGNTEKKGYEVSVLRAPIAMDGSLGIWIPTTPLPHSRAYIANTTMVLHDVLYVVAGFDGVGNTQKQTMLWTRPRPDGELSPWRESPPFPGPGLDNSAVVSTPGHIHLLGGMGQNGRVANVVWAAVINEQGDFVRWEAETPLPTTLWFHNAAVVAGRVWVWGGSINAAKTQLNTVLYSAPVNADGRIGQWRSEPFPLPQPFIRAAGTASGPFLLSFCPSYTDTLTSNDVWFAEITDRGVQPWQKLTTNLSMKVYIGIATDFRRGVIFLPGGRIQRLVAGALSNEVYYFRLAKKAMEKPDAQVAATITTPDEASNLPHLSYLYISDKPADSFSGFAPYEIARLQSLQSKLPLVVYFHSPKARPCETQRQALQKLDFSIYKDRVIFAWVDTTIFPQLVQQMGVFKVPSWIYFDGSGKELKRKLGIITEGELQSWLFGG